MYCIRVNFDRLQHFLPDVCPRALSIAGKSMLNCEPHVVHAPYCEYFIWFSLDFAHEIVNFR